MLHEPFNDIPLSESDKLLSEWGFSLLEEYLEIFNFTKFNIYSLLMDIGTGSGRGAAILTRMGYRVLSIDSDKNQQIKARKKIGRRFLKQIEFINKKIENLDFEKASIDDILCLNLIHELSKPEDVISKMITLFSGNGKILITDFNELGFATMEKLHNVIYGNSHSLGKISFDEVIEIFKKDKFKITEYNTKLNRTALITK